MKRGDDYFNAGDYTSAKIEYINVLRIDSKSAIAYLQLGKIWIGEGDILQGVRYLSRAQHLAPDNMEARVRLGEGLLSLGDAAAARTEAQTVLNKDPGNGEAIVLLCKAIRTRADADNASKQLQKISNPDSPSWQMAMAHLLLATGDRANGIKALNRAAILDPHSPDPHLTLAATLASEGNLPAAAQEYKAAADLSTSHGVARLSYAEFELLSGAPDKAESMLSQITATTPDYLPAWVLRARMAFTAKNLDDSLELVAKALAQDGQDLDAHILQAEVWLAKGNADSAITDLEQLGNPFSGMPTVNYHLALACLQKGDDPDALTALNHAVAESPNYTDALFLQAEVNLRLGNPASVVKPMLGLLKDRPWLSRANTLLATAYRSLKQFDDAADVLRKQIQSHPKDSQAYLMLGLTLLDQGNTADARAAFEQAQTLAPLDLTPTFQLVDLDINAGDYTAAFKRVQNQIALQPSSAMAQYLLGKIYATQKDWPHAQTALLKALDEDPNLLIAYHYLANTYTARNRPDLAIQTLETFLAKSPADIITRMDVAKLYDATGQSGKALDAYKKVLGLKPDSAAALNNLAYIYATEEQDLATAQGYAERALAVLPDDPNVADTLGWILYREGEYSQSLPHLLQSASKPPVQEEILYHLGMTEWMMDDPDAAREALKAAAGGSRDFSGKADIPARLVFMDKVESGAASRGEIEAFLKLHPGDVYALVALGKSCSAAGEWAKAAAAYGEALDRNPVLISAALDLAELNAGPLANPDKAFELAKKVRELSPSNIRAAGILGKAAWQRGDYSMAYTSLQRAMDSSQDDAHIHATLYDFAWAAYSQGKIAEAQSAMQRVAKAAPPGSPEAGDAGTFLGMIDLESNTNDLAAGESQISKLLEATPGYVPALMARARLRVSRGDKKGAEGDYETVLAHFPDFSLAQKDLASLYLQDPDNEARAYDLASKAHNALPDDPDVSAVLGDISYLRKEYSYAAQLLEESAAIRPLDTQSLYDLGMALWEMKNKPESRQTLEQAVSAGLAEPQLSEANRVLAELQKK